MPILHVKGEILKVEIKTIGGGTGCEGKANCNVYIMQVRKEIIDLMS